MPGNIVYGIYQDSSKRFWVGTDKGLAILDSTGKCTQNILPEAFRNMKISFDTQVRVRGVSLNVPVRGSKADRPPAQVPIKISPPYS